MKKILVAVMAVLFFTGCGVADKSKVVREDGSNEIVRYSIKDALNSPLAKEKLPSDIKFITYSFIWGNWCYDSFSCSRDCDYYLIYNKQ